MNEEKFDKYNPNYSYKKDSITISNSSLGYPIIEKTDNALLFPLGPKNNIDTEQLKE